MNVVDSTVAVDFCLDDDDDFVFPTMEINDAPRITLILNDVNELFHSIKFPNVLQIESLHFTLVLLKDGEHNSSILLRKYRVSEFYKLSLIDKVDVHLQTISHIRFLPSKRKDLDRFK